MGVLGKDGVLNQSYKLIRREVDPLSWHNLLQGGEELLVLVNAENNQPEVTLPSRGMLVVDEDEQLVISGAGVADIDMEVSSKYELAVRLSVEQGTLSLNGTNGLGFSIGDGVEDEVMYFNGPASSVNDALGSIIYRGHYNWWVDVLRVIGRDCAASLRYLNGNQFIMNPLTSVLSILGDLPCTSTNSTVTDEGFDTLMTSSY